MTTQQNEYNRCRYANNPEVRRKVREAQYRNRPQLYKQRNDRRRAKKAIIDKIREETVCANCGKQPIEWHHEEHTIYPNRRISRMLSKNKTLESILAEINVCVPLCRKCHIRMDGRLRNLRNFSETP